MPSATPACQADGRGWDQCPNLCFDLPGKVERKDTIGLRTIRTSPHDASASHKHIVPPVVDQSLHPARNPYLIGTCWKWLKVWIFFSFCYNAVLWKNLETLKGGKRRGKLFKLDVADVSSHLAAASLH